MGKIIDIWQLKPGMILGDGRKVKTIQTYDSSRVVIICTNGDRLELATSCKIPIRNKEKQ